MDPSQPTENFALNTISTSRGRGLRPCSIVMRIAWGGSLRSTPLIFRRRGDGAQEAELRTSLSIAPRSCFDFGRVSALQAASRPC